MGSTRGFFDPNLFHGNSRSDREGPSDELPPPRRWINPRTNLETCPPRRKNTNPNISEEDHERVYLQRMAYYFPNLPVRDKDDEELNPSYLEAEPSETVREVESLDDAQQYRLEQEQRVWELHERLDNWSLADEAMFNELESDRAQNGPGSLGNPPKGTVRQIVANPVLIPWQKAAQHIREDIKHNGTTGQTVSASEKPRVERDEQEKIKQQKQQKEKDTSVQMGSGSSETALQNNGWWGPVGRLPWHATDEEIAERERKRRNEIFPWHQVQQNNQNDNKQQAVQKDPSGAPEKFPPKNGSGASAFRSPWQMTDEEVVERDRKKNISEQKNDQKDIISNPNNQNFPDKKNQSSSATTENHGNVDPEKATSNDGVSSNGTVGQTVANPVVFPRQEAAQHKREDTKQQTGWEATSGASKKVPLFDATGIPVIIMPWESSYKETIAKSNETGQGSSEEALKNDNEASHNRTTGQIVSASEGSRADNVKQNAHENIKQELQKKEADKSAQKGSGSVMKAPTTAGNNGAIGQIFGYKREELNQGDRLVLDILEKQEKWRLREEQRAQEKWARLQVKWEEKGESRIGRASQSHCVNPFEKLKLKKIKLGSPEETSKNDDASNNRTIGLIDSATEESRADDVEQDKQANIKQEIQEKEEGTSVQMRSGVSEKIPQNDTWRAPVGEQETNHADSSSNTNSQNFPDNESQRSAPATTGRHDMLTGIASKNDGESSNETVRQTVANPAVPWQEAAQQNLEDTKQQAVQKGASEKTPPNDGSSSDKEIIVKSQESELSNKDSDKDGAPSNRTTGQTVSASEGPRADNVEYGNIEHEIQKKENRIDPRVYRLPWRSSDKEIIVKSNKSELPKKEDKKEDGAPSNETTGQTVSASEGPTVEQDEQDSIKQRKPKKEADKSAQNVSGSSEKAPKDDGSGAPVFKSPLDMTKEEMIARFKKETNRQNLLFNIVKANTNASGSLIKASNTGIVPNNGNIGGSVVVSEGPVEAQLDVIKEKEKKVAQEEQDKEKEEEEEPLSIRRNKKPSPSDPPGRIVTCPKNKIIFNAFGNDEESTCYFKLMNMSRFRIAFKITTNDPSRYSVDTPFDLLDAQKAILFALTTNVFQEENPKNDYLTIEWINAPDRTTMEFRHEWFAGDGLFSRKTLKIEYNE